MNQTETKRAYKIVCRGLDGGDYELSYGRQSKKITTVCARQPGGLFVNRASGKVGTLRDLKSEFATYAERVYRQGPDAVTPQAEPENYAPFESGPLPDTDPTPEQISVDQKARAAGGFEFFAALQIKTLVELYGPEAVLEAVQTVAAGGTLKTVGAKGYTK